MSIDDYHQEPDDEHLGAKPLPSDVEAAPKAHPVVRFIYYAALALAILTGSIALLGALAFAVLFIVCATGAM